MTKTCVRVFWSLAIANSGFGRFMWRLSGRTRKFHVYYISFWAWASTSVFFFIKCFIFWFCCLWYFQKTTSTSLCRNWSISGYFGPNSMLRPLLNRDYKTNLIICIFHIFFHRSSMILSLFLCFAFIILSLLYKKQSYL